MGFLTAANQILILFIIMFIGWIAKKTNIINEAVEKSISSVLIKIAMPAMVLASSSIAYNSQVLPNMINIFIVTIISYVVLIGFGTISSSILRLDKHTSNVYTSLIVFANVGFMGYPVVKALYGEIGVFYASIVNLVFFALIWSYGILLYNSQSKFNIKSLVNVGTISSIIGILLFLLQIAMPAPIFAALDLTGRMTAPLSMLLIGALIANINLKELLNDWKVYWVSFIKLLAIPVATAMILKLLNYNEMVISICTVMAAMPSAATNGIFAKEFNVNPKFASIGVFVTTLFSIVTIPLIVYFLTEIVF